MTRPNSTTAALAGSMPVIFLTFVFLTGGGSRSDVSSLPFLRGISLLFVFWAATRMRREDWSRVSVPLGLLLAMTGWIALQLVPLPPAIWQGLDGRDTVVAIDALLGNTDLWRPISMTPSLTLNSLLGMTVPIAALLLAARVSPDEYPRILMALVVLACFSAILGLIQILGGDSSPAYLYRITNSSSMVGLFANRNHHAFFLACMIPVVGTLMRDELQRKRRRSLVSAALGFALVLLTVMTVLIGSRAGFVAGVVAFSFAYAIVVAARRGPPVKPESPVRHAVTVRNAGRWLIYSPPVLLAALLGAALWLSDRTTSLTRLAGNDVVEDLRVRAWPTVRSMVETYWTTGSGFGSFPEVYKVYEPDGLLQQAYFNRAHNDWAEVVMTGGIPAVLILLFALLWIGSRIRERGLRNLLKGHRGDLRLAGILVLVILAAVSFVDYPLRVPSLQLFAIVMTIFLCCPFAREVQGE